MSDMGGHSDGVWRVWADTGGTFTDCIGIGPDGKARQAKVLSSGEIRLRIAEVVDARRVRIDRPEWVWGGLVAGMRGTMAGGGDIGARVVSFDEFAGVMEFEKEVNASEGAILELRAGEEAPVLAARVVTRTGLAEKLPRMELRVGTTRGTNALLEKRGGPAALIINRGLEDLLAIGTQQRPDLFALRVEKRGVLAERSVGIRGRLSADGREIEALDVAEVEAVGRALVGAGIQAAAVALLHSDVNGAHERAVGEALRRAGVRHVALSSESLPFVGLLARAERAVAEAYLAEIMERYLTGIKAKLGEGSRLLVMTSAGGLMDASAFRASDGLLSGPAGGVEGAAATARRDGFGKIITYDMGGTSTDVSRYAGRVEQVREHRVGDGLIAGLAVGVESVAAGGGSVCWFDGERFRVGPRSAGAKPGPACYGGGGELTITDVNLLLGRLTPAHFSVPIVREAAEGALVRLLREAQGAGAATGTREDVLAGFLAIANELMADAIRTISVRKGYDPAEHVLAAFGGAGGQHACAVADLLGIRQVFAPAESAHLSALGVGTAPVRRTAQAQLMRRLADTGVSGVMEIALRLEEEAIRQVRSQGVEAGRISVEGREVMMRLAGQEATIGVEWVMGEDLAERFEARYQAQYGCGSEGRAVEIESVRVTAAGGGNELPDFDGEVVHSGRDEKQRMWSGGKWQEAEVWNAEQAINLAGPALVKGNGFAVVVEPGWTCTRAAGGGLLLERQGKARRTETEGGRLNAVELELFSNRFAAAAGEMGEMLRRMAVSTNVKERLDYSCGVLDARGNLVVNAPHIPVHLGALGECVRRVAEVVRMEEGDVIITNHPAFGGSHLPDVTLITPVFVAGELLGYVANRAHHAEIGGSRPGSMPPGARSLEEEGVVIAPRTLMEGGVARWDEIEGMLRGGKFPSRAVNENLADLRGALAANVRGAGLLTEMVKTHGAARVREAMAEVLRSGEAKVRRALARIGEKEFAARDTLDDGTMLAVRVDVRGGEARVDFDGCGPTHAGNLNATTAIVRSVVMYVVRLLLNEPVPLNEGLLRPVEIRIPKGSLLNPEFSAESGKCPAVVGGNTETSQRLVELLMQALAPVLRSAGSQATMNNVLFGNEAFGYYETVCGGTGAGEGFGGASAVHSHMTNTRLTDVEVLERRYPVRVEEFAIRRGSGGKGRWRGGEGVRRRLRFLDDVALSVLTQHRTHGPFGAEGGERGAAGAQRLERADGSVLLLGAIDGAEARAGDVFVLETPGGGGYGRV